MFARKVLHSPTLRVGSWPHPKILGKPAELPRANNQVYFPATEVMEKEEIFFYNIYTRRSSAATAGPTSSGRKKVPPRPENLFQFWFSRHFFRGVADFPAILFPGFSGKFHSRIFPQISFVDFPAILFPGFSRHLISRIFPPISFTLWGLWIPHNLNHRDRLNKSVL